MQFSKHYTPRFFMVPTLKQSNEASLLSLSQTTLEVERNVKGLFCQFFTDYLSHMPLNRLSKKTIKEKSAQIGEALVELYRKVDLLKNRIPNRHDLFKNPLTTLLEEGKEAEA